MTASALTSITTAALVAAAILLSTARAGAVSQIDVPEACPLEPVSLPLFGATPAATIAASPGHDEPAKADDAGVQDAVATIIACVSSESQAQRYAVFTERYLASLFVGVAPADQPAFERKIATGAVPEAFRVTLESVSDIERQPDGRIAVTMHLLGAEGPLTDRVLLAWDADAHAWLIDEIISLDPPPAE